MNRREPQGSSAPRVRYRAGDLPGLLRTPVGRLQLRRSLDWLAWFALAPLAALDRRLRLARHPVVAISGTFGKTSTALAIAAALGSPPPPLNYRTYLASGLLRVRRAGPPAVFEVGVSRPGQMAGYARLLAPSISVITAVGSEHLTSFGTLEAIQAEKQQLVARLGPGDLAVLNGDDPRVASMAAATAARTVTFGLGAGNDLRAERIHLDWPHGTRFELVAPEGRHELLIRSLGRHAACAALAAIAVARELGQPLATTLARLAELAPAPRRLEPVALPNGAWLLLDTVKAELETIDAALDLFEQIPARRKLVVLGPINEPPQPAGPAYRHLGTRLGATVDRILGCGSYRKSFDTLVAAARAAGLARAASTYCLTVDEIAGRLADELVAGDVVLLKGQSNLRFERVALALGGRAVRCRIRRCYAKGLPCARCAMLERGWDGLRELT